MLLGTWAGSLFRNLLPDKGTIKTSECTIKASQDFICHKIL